LDGETVSASTGRLSVDEGSHVVQFYGRDDELVDRVGDYLVEAVQAGEVAVVVATAAHGVAFEARMLAAGVDVAAARARGAFVVLDARATMRRFLVDDRPDPDGFQSVIGGLIRQAGEAGRSVRVYGEMVALLWEAGHVNAAIELEALWNDLGRQLPFSLFCAYSTQSVIGEAHLEALEEVCRLHSAVVGAAPATVAYATAPPPGVPAPAEVVRSFVAGPGAPRAARQFVIETLHGWRNEKFAADAALLVTELATNAVVHARSDFTVTVSPALGGVRISVRDASTVLPAPRIPTVVAASGRGLGLVAAMASRWDVEPLPEGKLVWAELRS
jgi:hypothetical protein